MEKKKELLIESTSVYEYSRRFKEKLYIEYPISNISHVNPAYIDPVFD